MAFHPESCRRRRTMVQKQVVLSFMLMIIVLVASFAEAGTIDGRVVNGSGRGGRLYLSLKNNDGSGETNLGTSLLAVGTDPASFSVTGVADGSYTLSAWLDTGGGALRHANDP